MDEQKLKEILDKYESYGYAEYWKGGKAHYSGELKNMGLDTAVAAIQALHKDSLREARIDEVSKAYVNNKIPYAGYVQDRIDRLNRKEP